MGVNIAELQGKIKARLDMGLAEWGLFLVVILIGIASFGLGRFSALEDTRPPISLTETALAGSPKDLSIGGLVVASRTGSVYYYPWCSGASSIKDTNKRWFSDEASAQAAGYRPSKSCQGLNGQ